jgi:hypothetical protein
MTATPSETSPLARLILVIACLALAGSMIAGVHYLTIDLPSQDSTKAPLNLVNVNNNCDVQYRTCLAACNGWFTPYEKSVCYHSCADFVNMCNANPTENNP